MRLLVALGIVAAGARHKDEVLDALGLLAELEDLLDEGELVLQRGGRSAGCDAARAATTGRKRTLLAGGMRHSVSTPSSFSLSSSMPSTGIVSTWYSSRMSLASGPGSPNVRPTTLANLPSKSESERRSSTRDEPVWPSTAVTATTRCDLVDEPLDLADEVAFDESSPFLASAVRFF